MLSILQWLWVSRSNTWALNINWNGFFSFFLLLFLAVNADFETQQRRHNDNFEKDLSELCAQNMHKMRDKKRNIHFWLSALLIYRFCDLTFPHFTIAVACIFFLFSSLICMVLWVWFTWVQWQHITTTTTTKWMKKKKRNNRKYE